jgi:hypothetical protein
LIYLLKNHKPVKKYAKIIENDINDSNNIDNNNSLDEHIGLSYRINLNEKLILKNNNEEEN